MIVCDIDGVLADFDGAFDKYIRQHIPNLGPQILDKYDFRDRYDYNPDALLRLFNKFAREGKFIELKPYADIQKVNEFNPTIITSRPQITASDTYAWLKANKIKFKRVLFARHKSKYVSDTTAIFEDKAKNIMPFANAGVKCFIYDHLYNQDAKHENITRFKDWKSLDTKKLLKEFKNGN